MRTLFIKILYPNNYFAYRTGWLRDSAGNKFAISHTEINKVEVADTIGYIEYKIDYYKKRIALQDGNNYIVLYFAPNKIKLLNLFYHLLPSSLKTCVVSKEKFDSFNLSRLYPLEDKKLPNSTIVLFSSLLAILLYLTILHNYYLRDMCFILLLGASINLLISKRQFQKLILSAILLPVVCFYMLNIIELNFLMYIAVGLIAVAFCVQIAQFTIKYFSLKQASH